MSSDQIAPTTVDVLGTPLAYRRKGSGEPLVVLTGLGFAGRWLPLYDLLAERYDVIVPDLPGFGDSPAAPWLRGFDDLAMLLAELADTLGPEPFHLVGHSFGGWVAAEFAAFYPERLRTLTLVSPLGLRVPGKAPLDLFRRSAEGRLDAILNGGDAAAITVTDDDPLDHLLRDYAELTAFAQFAWNPRYDILLDRRLARVRVPALVIGGEEDRVLPAEHLDRYVELLPDARRQIVAGTSTPSGHGLPLTEPEALAAAVRAFIEEN